MTLTDKMYYESTCHYIFNYYNGRINIFNTPCILKIDWQPPEDFEYFELAKFSRPNIVTVHMLHLVAICKFLDIHPAIVMAEILIHELFHADQDPVPACDISFKMETIEIPVVNMSYDYIHAHIHEIAGFIGPQCDIESLKDKISKYEESQIHFDYLYTYQTDVYFPYKRVCDWKHIFYTLVHLLPGIDMNAILRFFINPDKMVMLEYKSHMYSLKCADAYMPIPQFNHLINSIWTKWDSGGLIEFYQEISGDHMIIHIRDHAPNINMVTPIKFYDHFSNMQNLMSDLMEEIE